MARGRIRTFRGPSRPRRATEWFASADIDSEQAYPAGSVVLDQSLTAASLASILPATIVRTRGLLWVRTDQFAATEQPFGALGMAVVSEQARVAGVASLPSPITEEQSDLWFVHQFWATGILFGSATSGIRAGDVYEFDSRAQRKVEDGSAVVVMIENAQATDGMTGMLKFRMLFKLH